MNKHFIFIKVQHTTTTNTHKWDPQNIVNDYFKVTRKTKTKWKYFKNNKNIHKINMQLLCWSLWWWWMVKKSQYCSGFYSLFIYFGCIFYFSQINGVYWPTTNNNIKAKTFTHINLNTNRFLIHSLKLRFKYLYFIDIQNSALKSESKFGFRYNLKLNSLVLNWFLSVLVLF